MTRKFLPPFTALLSFLLLMFSCKKEQQENIHELVNKIPFSITEAKSWYSNQLNKNISSVANRSSSDNKIKPFAIIWDKAITCEDSKYYVVECPLKFDDSPGYIVLPNNGNTTINGITRLLILKDKISEYIQSALIHIYSESGFVDEGNGYSKRKNDFTGTIFFTDLNGSFINGWIYQDGKIIKKSKPNTSSIVARVAPPPSDECQVIETRWYIRTCQYYDDGSELCTEWRYMSSTFTTYCPDGSGDGGYNNNNSLPACNMTQEEARNALNSVSISHVDIISSSSGSEYGPDYLGIIRKPWQSQWTFVRFVYGSTGYYTEYSAKFTGIVYKQNTNPSVNWKFESMKYSNTQLTDGAVPPCFSQTLNATVTPVVIATDKFTATVALSYTATLSVSCLLGMEINRISDSEPPKVFTAG